MAHTTLDQEDLDHLTITHHLIRVTPLQVVPEEATLDSKVRGLGDLGATLWEDRPTMEAGNPPRCTTGEVGTTDPGTLIPQPLVVTPQPVGHPQIAQVMDQPVKATLQIIHTIL